MGNIEPGNPRIEHPFPLQEDDLDHGRLDFPENKKGLTPDSADVDKAAQAGESNKQATIDNPTKPEATLVISDDEALIERAIDAKEHANKLVKLLHGDLKEELAEANIGSAAEKAQQMLIDRDETMDRPS